MPADMADAFENFTDVKKRAIEELVRENRVFQSRRWETDARLDEQVKEADRGVMFGEEPDWRLPSRLRP